MATAITDLYPYLRHLLGDRDSAIQEYEDAALLTAVRTAIRTNALPNFSLTSDSNSITPAVSDANQFALLLYRVVRSFAAARPDRRSVRTRAFTETEGSWRTFLHELENDIHRLENGDLFSGWQSFYGWLEGVSGLSVGHLLTEVQTTGTIRTLSIPNAGD